MLSHSQPILLQPHKMPTDSAPINQVASIVNRLKNLAFDPKQFDVRETSNGIMIRFVAPATDPKLEMPFDVLNDETYIPPNGAPYKRRVKIVAGTWERTVGNNAFTVTTDSPDSETSDTSAADPDTYDENGLPDYYATAKDNCILDDGDDQWWIAQLGADKHSDHPTMLSLVKADTRPDLSKENGAENEEFQRFHMKRVLAHVYNEQGVISIWQEWRGTITDLLEQTDSAEDSCKTIGWSGEGHLEDYGASSRLLAQDVFLRENDKGIAWYDKRENSLEKKYARFDTHDNSQWYSGSSLELIEDKMMQIHGFYAASPTGTPTEPDDLSGDPYYVMGRKKVGNNNECEVCYLDLSTWTVQEAKHSVTADTATSYTGTILCSQVDWTDTTCVVDCVHINWSDPSCAANLLSGGLQSQLDSRYMPKPDPMPGSRSNLQCIDSYTGETVSFSIINGIVYL